MNLRNRYSVRVLNFFNAVRQSSKTGNRIKNNPSCNNVSNHAHKILYSLAERIIMERWCRGSDK